MCTHHIRVILYHGVRRPGDRLLGLLRFAQVNPKVLHHRTPGVVGQTPRVVVAHPCVHSAPARVNVVHVLEAEVVF